MGHDRVMGVLRAGSVVARKAREAGRAAFDFVYPPECCVCEAQADRLGWVCDACDAALVDTFAKPACDRCGHTLAQADAGCQQCKGGGLPFFRHVHAFGPYVPPLDRVVRLIKYEKRWTLAEALAGRALEDCERTRAAVDSADVICPVPLHRARQRARGFNQSQVLARRLGRLANKPCTDLLTRERDTPAQTTLDSAARRHENVRDAFALTTEPSAIQGSRILLVDDVATTGATLIACAREIAKAKPAEINALVIARANPPGSNAPMP